MYTPPLFRVETDAALAFATERGFGTFIAVADGRPVAAHLPFALERTGEDVRLEVHVARSNPMHGIVATSRDVLVTVTGPDAYISPDWYLAGDQVPTWNYVAVHLSGTARLIAESDNLAVVDRLSAVFEDRLKPKPPWKSDKMTPARKEAMLKAIVAFEVNVTAVEASFKLSQNKPRADRMEVSRMLDWRGDWGSRGVSALMNAALKAPPDRRS
jgi:transcriptional regulator